MSDNETKLLVRKNFDLDEKALKILDEFSEALQDRLKQVPEKLSQLQLLKCWQSYLQERLPVYPS